MKRFHVKAMCSVMIDVGTIEAGSFAAAENAARRLVSEKYPAGRVHLWPLPLHGGDALEATVEAALAVREERERRPA